MTARARSARAHSATHRPLWEAGVLDSPEVFARMEAAWFLARFDAAADAARYYSRHPDWRDPHSTFKKCGSHPFLLHVLRPIDVSCRTGPVLSRSSQLSRPVARAPTPTSNRSGTAQSHSLPRLCVRPNESDAGRRPSRRSITTSAWLTSR